METFTGFKTRFPDKDAVKELEARVNRSALHFWQPGDEIEHSVPRCLIGVGEWMGLDMRLLDDVNAWLHQSEANEQSIRFDIFNFWANCLKQEDLEQYIPGMDIRQIYHSPIVGYWDDGKLLWFAEGYDARQRVRKLLK